MIGKVLWAIFLVLAGFFYGLTAYKFDLAPVPQLRFVKEHIAGERGVRVGVNDTENRIEVSCKRADAETIVLLTAGQSNSANHGQTRYTPTGDVVNFNWFDGKCYKAADPLLGATGKGGSVWTRLGELMTRANPSRRVVIAPVGVDATSIKRWVPGGDLHFRIEEALAGLRRAGLKPDAVLWHQGERDTQDGMDGKSYSKLLQQTLKSLRKKAGGAPVFIAFATICHNPGSPAIRAAQIDAARSLEGVYPGPATDSLDRMAWRYDGCHFSHAALEWVARRWHQAILDYKTRY